MQLNDLDEALVAQTQRLEDAKNEIVAKLGELTTTIVDLQNALNNVELPADAVAALTAHIEKIREVEDIVA